MIMNLLYSGACNFYSALHALSGTAVSTAISYHNARLDW